MQNLIEEMYCNGFNLKNDGEQAAKLRRLSDQVLKQEMQLKSMLSPHALAIFEEYLECSSELMSCNGCVEFISGFRLGGRLTSEMVFGADDDMELCG